MNGDSLHNIVWAAQAAGGQFLAHVYMFSYLALAIYVVINIIIATTEESFFKSKKIQRVVHRFLRRALQQLDEMDDYQEEYHHAFQSADEEEDRDEDKNGEQDDDEKDRVLVTASSVGVLQDDEKKGAEVRQQNKRLEKEDKGQDEPAAMYTNGSNRAVPRGRSDTLFSFHNHEAAEEDTFRTLMMLLIQEYRID